MSLLVRNVWQSTTGIWVALAIQLDFIDGSHLTAWFWIIETIYFRM